LLIATINGQPAHLHPLSRFLQDAGFQAAPLGFNVRRILPPIQSASAEVQ
jgi:ATP-dependent helicase Lhr and Lhr-like helicase